MTSIPKSYLSSLNVPIGSSHATFCDSDSDSESDDGDFGEESGEDTDIDVLNLAYSSTEGVDDTLEEWFATIRRDPLRRARRLVSFLRASGQRKEGLRELIKRGNESNLFIGRKDGNLAVVTIPQLELLKDVKTRWDSVYFMLRRLRQLRPVGFSW
jgi:hypothetical protein